MSVNSEPKNNHWHVRKEVTAGHILITVSLLAGAIASWFSTNHNISLNAKEIEHVKEINRIQNNKFQAAILRVEAQYEKIDNKLDELRKEFRR